MSTPQQQADADLSEQLVLVQALMAIAHESDEAEIVRVAFSAILNTQVGLTYLQAHPFTI